jgi:hypothetical protein
VGSREILPALVQLCQELQLTSHPFVSIAVGGEFDCQHPLRCHNGLGELTLRAQRFGFLLEPVSFLKSFLLILGQRWARLRRFLGQDRPTYQDQDQRQAIGSLASSRK